MLLLISKETRQSPGWETPTYVGIFPVLTGQCPTCPACQNCTVCQVCPTPPPPAPNATITSKTYNCLLLCLLYDWLQHHV